MIKLGFILSSDVVLNVKVFFISDLLLPPIKDPKKVPNEFFSAVPDGEDAFTLFTDNGDFSTSGP